MGLNNDKKENCSIPPVKSFIINDKEFVIEVQAFLDKSELNEKGYYDYYYSGYYFTITQGNDVIKGRKYDYNEYVSFLGPELLNTIQKNIKEIKIIINDTFNVGRIVHINYGDNYHYWGNKLEDEQNWRLGLRNGNGKLFYCNDSLWCEGGFLEAKFHGKGKLYGRDGELLFEGEFVDGNPVK